MENSKNRARSLGLGSSELLLGEEGGKFGYYGKYKGIATPNEVISLGGITEGVTKNDANNNQNDNITWLKFSHNYKTLFIADRTIHHSISWSHLNSKGLVFGKVIDIGGQKYLLRLMQGANINPSDIGGSPDSNDEWGSLIKRFTPSTDDSHWSVSDAVNVNGGKYTWCQETSQYAIDRRMVKGDTSVDFSGNSVISLNTKDFGYRPVLEVL